MWSGNVSEFPSPKRGVRVIFGRKKKPTRCAFSKAKEKTTIWLDTLKGDTRHHLFFYISQCYLNLYLNQAKPLKKKTRATG